MTSDNPLGLEPDNFDEQGREPIPPDVDPTVDYDPPESPELFEWTPERAGAVIKAGGYVLHTADPLSSDPGGEQLWKATEQDAADAGAPLARILNRYAPARRLAGVVDEAEFGAAMFAYAKRNLAVRGRLVRARKLREQDEGPAGPEVWRDVDEGPPIVDVDERPFGEAPEGPPGV